jgi:ParB-like chromosome segregation protein Spo0J
MSTEAAETTTEATLVKIPLEQLRANPLNLRRTVGDVKSLTKSVAAVGIVVP